VQHGPHGPHRMRARGHTLTNFCDFFFFLIDENKPEALLYDKCIVISVIVFVK
jgi:hypothetical protein